MKRAVTVLAVIAFVGSGIASSSARTGWVTIAKGWAKGTAPGVTLNADASKPQAFRIGVAGNYPPAPVWWGMDCINWEPDEVNEEGTPFHKEDTEDLEPGQFLEVEVPEDAKHCYMNAFVNAGSAEGGKLVLIVQTR